MQEFKDKSTNYLNVLRAIAILAVLCLHVVSPIVSQYKTYLNMDEYLILVIARNIWSWCVPIFVMISGVIFLNPRKEISIVKLLSKYVFRLVLALLVFGISYAWLEIIFYEKRINIHQLYQAFLYVLQGKTWDHMWYLYMIIGMYLLIPIIKRFINNTVKREIEYFLLVLFIFTSVFPVLKNLIGITIGITFPIISVYLFYFILGYYLHYYNVINNKLISVGCFLAYLVYVFVASIFKLYNINGVVWNLNYDSPIVVIGAIGIFTLNLKNSNKIFDWLARISFGMYLIHPIFINILYKVFKFTPENNPLLLVIFTVLLITLVMSSVISFGLKKIGIIDKYLL